MTGNMFDRYLCWVFPTSTKGSTSCHSQKILIAQYIHMFITNHDNLNAAMQLLGVIPKSDVHIRCFFSNQPDRRGE
eukprot:m.430568 g.430568  ORF g.430568 m.430568 type:complete len:76 (+) comp21397_c1_seq2:1220-1447(+)